MSTKRFATSLKEVSEQLGAPYSAVTEWRDAEGCPFLEKSPYDVDAILMWLTKRAQLQIDPTSELQMQKLQAEIDKLKRDGSLFSRDKMFWLAAIALGASVADKVREWIARPKKQPLRVLLFGIGRKERLRQLLTGHDVKVFEELMPESLFDALSTGRFFDVVIVDARPVYSDMNDGCRLQADAKFQGDALHRASRELRMLQDLYDDTGMFTYPDRPAIVIIVEEPVTDEVRDGALGLVCYLESDVLSEQEFVVRLNRFNSNDLGSNDLGSL